jgi:hypothetical protein
VPQIMTTSSSHAAGDAKLTDLLQTFPTARGALGQHPRPMQGKVRPFIATGNKMKKAAAPQVDEIPAP